MIRRMAQHFSPQIVWELITPSYPYPDELGRQMSASEKIFSRLLPTTDKSTAEQVAAFSPDIVYTDSPLYGTQFKLYSYAHGNRVPVILHLRGDWWYEYWVWFRSAGWKQRALSSQIYVYQSLSTVLARKITPICRWLESVVKHYVPFQDTEVVYQGVAPEEFGSEPGMTLRHPAVAIIQNHTVYAKVVGLLKFAEVVKKLPNIQFYIAEGERVRQGFLPRVKDRFGGFHNVHFVEGVDNPLAVKRLLTAVDCYVLASGLDCCPTTVLEASLMRKPVIASRIGGVPEIVLENQTGWTVRNDDPKTWVEKITLALSDAQLNRKMGQAGREWVIKKFAWINIARQVENILVSETR